MRILRLAQLFELKYGLKVEAVASPADILMRVKKDIDNNYKNWVMGKYPALRSLAVLNEPYAKKLFGIYTDLVDNLDGFSPVQILNRLNKILGLIKSMKDNPKDYRESIHNILEISRESDRNAREKLKSGFETNLKNISFELEKAAKILKAFSPDTEITGGAVDPQRKDLSKEKLLMFMRTPAAQRYGLNDINVMTEVLLDPEFKNRITTLINAIDRGHTPIDGPEVNAEAQRIKKWLESREKTNLPALEQIPENPASGTSLFDNEDNGMK